MPASESYPSLRWLRVNPPQLPPDSDPDLLVFTGPGGGNGIPVGLEHRWLIEQAKGVIMGREELDAQAAFERLRRAARNSTWRLADVAKDVTAGQPLPADRRKLARGRAEHAKNRETNT